MHIICESLVSDTHQQPSISSRLLTEHKSRSSSISNQSTLQTFWFHVLSSITLAATIDYIATLILHMQFPSKWTGQSQLWGNDSLLIYRSSAWTNNTIHLDTCLTMFVLCEYSTRIVPNLMSKWEYNAEFLYWNEMPATQTTHNRASFSIKVWNNSAKLLNR